MLSDQLERITQMSFEEDYEAVAVADAQSSAVKQLHIEIAERLLNLCLHRVIRLNRLTQTVDVVVDVVERGVVQVGPDRLG